MTCDTATPHNVLPVERYKTRLCERFMSKGACKYRRHCIFAHGPGELRGHGPPPPPPYARSGVTAPVASLRVVPSSPVVRRWRHDPYAVAVRPTAVPRHDDATISAPLPVCATGGDAFEPHGASELLVAARTPAPPQPVCAG